MEGGSLGGGGGGGATQSSDLTSCEVLALGWAEIENPKQSNRIIIFLKETLQKPNPQNIATRTII